MSFKGRRYKQSPADGNDSVRSSTSIAINKKSGVSVAGGAYRDARSNASVIQKYYRINGQKTSDQDSFEENATQKQKEDQVWGIVFNHLILVYHLSEGLLERFKKKILRLALDDTRHSISRLASDLAALQEEEEHRNAFTAAPLISADAPPNGLNQITHKGFATDSEKHTRSIYEFDDSEERIFDTDAYTKGPSRRARDDIENTEEFAQNRLPVARDEVLNWIKKWDCSTPLVRHLAFYLWPRIQDSEDGMEWYIKLLEMDRLVGLREEDARPISYNYREQGEERYASLDEKDYRSGARKSLKRAILQEQPLPPNQSAMLFYDTALKTAAPSEIQVADAEHFALNPRLCEISGSVSMTLTHWRTIVYFDWILVKDILKNSDY